MRAAPKPVEIVGGGLAGLALGIGLRGAGVPVTIVEAGDYPRHRVCGEFISGLSEATIDRLGIAGVFEGALKHTRASWFLPGGRMVEMTLPEEARGLSRFVLDSRLASLFVARGGELITGIRESDTDVGEGRVLTSGRRRINNAPWVGLKVHLRGIDQINQLEMHLGRDAYVGLARVEDGWINLCGLFKRRAGLKMDSVEGLQTTLIASGLEELAGRVAGAKLREGSASAVAGFDFDRRITRNPGVSLGDRCAMIPPFTGNGMAMAFTSAALAVEPLADWAFAETSWDEAGRRIERGLRRKFRTRVSSAALLNSILLHPGGQFGITALARTGLLPMRSLYRLLH